MWRGGNIHVWILEASNWATGTADEVFDLLTVCAFDCLTNIVSATHDSSVRINGRMSSFGQSLRFRFRSSASLTSVLAKQVFESLSSWILILFMLLYRWRCFGRYHMNHVHLPGLVLGNTGYKDPIIGTVPAWGRVDADVTAI